MIQLDDVFVLYRGARRDTAALRGLSLSVASGQRVVIHGASGSGKSTLVKLLTAQLVPSAGTAIILGHQLDALDPRQTSQLRRESMGIIHQHSGDDLIAELTCLQNVMLQPQLAGWSASRCAESAQQTMEILGVWSFANRRPNQLSNGELQRVAVAAALAHQPALIVADEPTGQLDADNADAVYGLLDQIASSYGATMIVASHDIGAGRLGDRVVNLADGRLSSETRTTVAGVTTSVVVDRRGWLRIPPTDRSLAAIGSFVTITADHHALTLSAADASTSVDDSGSQDNQISQVSGSQRSHDWVVKTSDASVLCDGVVVLKPVTCQIFNERLNAIGGRSGSGKTTLLSLLAGWQLPTSGHTLRANPNESISVCSATPVFAESLTVLQNLDLAANVRGQGRGPNTDAILQSLGLNDLANRPTSELSGGERQRVAIARCLSSNATLLLFDEPTAQLDLVSADMVISVLAKEAVDRTVICATHDDRLLHAAHHLIML